MVRGPPRSFSLFCYEESFRIIRSRSDSITPQARSPVTAPPPIFCLCLGPPRLFCINTTPVSDPAAKDEWPGFPADEYCRERKVRYQRPRHEAATLRHGPTRTGQCLWMYMLIASYPFRFVYSLCRPLFLSIYLIHMSRSNLNVDIWRTCRTLKYEVCARICTPLVASSSTGKYGKIAARSGAGTRHSSRLKT